MWIALLAAAALFASDRLLKHLARQGKLTFSAANGHVVTTHHENSGMMFGLCKKRQTLARYLPCVSLLAVLSFFPEKHPVQSRYRPVYAGRYQQYI